MYRLNKIKNNDGDYEFFIGEDSSLDHFVGYSEYEFDHDFYDIELSLLHYFSNDKIYDMVRNDTYNFFVSFAIDRSVYDEFIKITGYHDGIISFSYELDFDGSVITFHDIAFDVRNNDIISNSVTNQPEMSI